MLISEEDGVYDLSISSFPDDICSEIIYLFSTQLSINFSILRHPFYIPV